jgi:hypothetical protein
VSLRPIPWRKKQAPLPTPTSRKSKSSAPLPQCDFLVDTWKVAAVHYRSLSRSGASAAKVNRLGGFSRTGIGGRSVLGFKSELHLRQDGVKLPVKDPWRQLPDEVRPKRVITTGTSGAIGPKLKLGDVVATHHVRVVWGPEYKKARFNQQEFSSNLPLPAAYLQPANQQHLPVNADTLPANSLTPLIYTDAGNTLKVPDVVTTDLCAYNSTTQPPRAPLPPGPISPASTDFVQRSPRTNFKTQGETTLFIEP